MQTLRASYTVLTDSSSLGREALTATSMSNGRLLKAANSDRKSKATLANIKCGSPYHCLGIWEKNIRFKVPKSFVSTDSGRYEPKMGVARHLLAECSGGSVGGYLDNTQLRAPHHEEER